VTAVPPIRREILVDTDPPRAFEVFTEGIARWWPLAEFGVFGEGASVAFEDGNIVERSTEGERAVWGTVTRWDPPGDLAFTWHPGRTPDKAGLVEVTFEERAQRTLVSLQHSGWEAFDDPAAARAEYDHGWPVVLDRYLSEIIRPTTGHSGTGDTWRWIRLRRPPLRRARRVPRSDGHGRLPGRSRSTFRCAWRRHDDPAAARGGPTRTGHSPGDRG
jgi:hypothetical protein